MTQRAKLMETIRQNPRDVRFADLLRAVEASGFELVRTRGSHRNYRHAIHRKAALNLQPKAGKAKPYQVLQFLAPIANVPDLKYCSAHGDTPEEAAREIRVAMELWLETWLETHEAPPAVKYRPSYADQAA